jgi:ABC-2 type transport system ATP-binding protein
MVIGAMHRRGRFVRVDVVTGTDAQDLRPDPRQPPVEPGRAGPFRDRAGTAAIEVVGLTKRYGAVLAVEDLSFTAAYGRIVGFLGPNGAGKTTTLRMLLGLVRPTRGTATIASCQYAELPDPVHTVGALLNGGALHPGRSGRHHLEALARAAGLSGRRVEELLRLVGLKDAADRRAGGYSLGMRQRLGLAGALLADPDVLVLDEPANGLDPEGIRWLRDFLSGLADEGRAVLISSHALAEIAQTVDDVVVMRKGRSVLQAPLAQLLTEHPTGVRVTGPDTGPLADRLRTAGAEVASDGPGAILVHHRGEEEVLGMVARYQLVVSKVSPIGSPLEEIYLDLTASPQGDRS